MIRRATPDDAAEVARLLHDFNSEYEEHTPGVEALTGHYRELIGAGLLTVMLAVGAGDADAPGCDGFAQFRLKHSHYTGRPDAHVEELYVVPGRRGHGIEQLDHEGVVQVLRSDLRGDQAPVLAAVGPMQFEVAEHRMGHEFGAPVTLERLDYSLARRTDHASAPALNAQRSVEVLSRTDGELLAIFSDRWRLQSVERELPDAVLEPLVVSV